MRIGIDDRPVQLVSDGCPAIAPIDRRLVGLAVRQLLDNALKYSPPGKPVTVRVNDSGSVIEVAITDQGQGIPPQEQGRIFERLYRSPSVKRKIPGSGLGLSIALNIVRAHHGDLTVTSRPGQTTFCMTLPASAEGTAQ
jgi:signal transduction histidine kinase